MSLAELTQEYERQVAAPVRRFDRPRDILKFIVEEAPTREERVTIDCCVLSVEELDLCWHINMIDKSVNDDFEERKAIIQKLDDESKWVFCLALWKAKKQSRDHATGDDYVPGRAYVVANVSGLHLYKGVAQGSLQARFATKNECVDARGKGKRKAKEQKP